MAASSDRAYERARQLIHGAGEASELTLDLSDMGLTTLPPEVGQLSTLRNLSLNRNRLSILPPEVGQLVNLESLDLNENRLARLPPEIGHLSNVMVLTLSDNQLVALPREIGHLFKLRLLYLGKNRLKVLPPEIGQLTRLESLIVWSNELTSLPAEIGQLVCLKTLDLDFNGLMALPPEIGQLTHLGELGLRRNQLKTLPLELGRLQEKLGLTLDGNPLGAPLPELSQRGSAAVLSYLRSLVESVPQYEAKLLLVGEGNVGKTSLVDALLGRPFVENRPTTHGIERGRLAYIHPGSGHEIILNSWDFGGQEVYRVTHQFFFSKRALYLLVWRPREGQEENAIEGWLQRIRLRVGSNARVMIVATHRDERVAELDYATLVAKFGNIVAGHYEVDNRSGHGLEALRQAIAQEASKLPQMGEPVSVRWIAARDDVLRHSDPQIERNVSSLH